MDFISFARAHGILLDALPPVGAWRRYKTEDKPTHRNGAVKFMGDHGFIQNHATMQEVAVWRSESDSPISRQRVQQIAQQAADQTAREAQEAAKKAEWILDQCQVMSHAYTASKGFPDEPVHVWARDDGPLLVIPMRVAGKITSAQLINEAGQKKFLRGGRTSGAEFVFGNGGLHVLCEGFATGLTVRHAMKHLKRRYTLHVCFSAQNMLRIAQTLPGGLVIADNDESGTGERIAREIGWAYWMSDRVGEDANDAHLRGGMFALTQGISRALARVPA